MLPYYAGGLNVVNLKMWNRAAICKLLWRLYQGKESIWVRWIHVYYIKNQDIFEMAIPMQYSWVMRKIFGTREHLRALHNGREWITRPEFSVSSCMLALLKLLRKCSGLK